MGDPTQGNNILPPNSTDPTNLRLNFPPVYRAIKGKKLTESEWNIYIFVNDSSDASQLTVNPEMTMQELQEKLSDYYTGLNPEDIAGIKPIKLSGKSERINLNKKINEYPKLKNITGGIDVDLIFKPQGGSRKFKKSRSKKSKKSRKSRKSRK